MTPRHDRYARVRAQEAAEADLRRSRAKWERFELVLRARGQVFEAELLGHLLRSHAATQVPVHFGSLTRITPGGHESP